MKRRQRPIDRIAYRRPEAAAALGVGVTTFDQWVSSGLMPKPIRVGGCVLWDAAEILAAWHAIATSESVDSPNEWDAD